MDKKDKALKLALEALEEIAQGASSDFEDAWCGAIAENVLPAIREALAHAPEVREQPASKPWVHATTWRGLTDEEIAPINEVYEFFDGFTGYARAIEAKLREKNA